MDIPSSGSVTIKMEPGTQDVDARVIPSTYIEIEVPNIKEECLDYFEDKHQTDGKDVFLFVKLGIPVPLMLSNSS